MASTSYNLNFKVDRKEEEICTKTLSQEELKTFRTVCVFLQRFCFAGVASSF